MYEVSQRYNFESKSQLVPDNVFCLLDVWSKSKIQFWKQITTGSSSTTHIKVMYEVSQRYNFESKSQQKAFALVDSAWCMK